MATTRRIQRTVQGHPATDGAGVRLIRVLGIRTVEDFDPFLMLDAFESRDPREYEKGFPRHPHRGIETLTYLISGVMEHKDNLGHKGVIRSGEAQWMTAGSGILHEEMPRPTDLLAGLQIWFNLPRSKKMTDPAYFDITADKMGAATDGAAEVKVIAGNYKGTRGVRSPHREAEVYDIRLPAGAEVAFPVKADDTAFVFLIEGDAVLDGKRVPARTAVLLADGDQVKVKAPPDAASRFLFLAAPPIREPVAWGGPVVMNSEAELETAFAELESGTFVKHGAKG